MKVNSVNDLTQNKNLLFDLSEHKLVLSKCLKVWDAFYVKMKRFCWWWE